MRAQGAIENALFNPQLKINIYGAVEPAGPGRAQTCVQTGLGPKRVGVLFRHEARGADLGPGRGAGPRGLRPCAAPLRACQCLPGSVRATECSKSAVGSRALPGSGALSSGRRPGGVPCAEERPRPRSGSESVTPPLPGNSHDVIMPAPRRPTHRPEPAAQKPSQAEIESAAPEPLSTGDRGERSSRSAAQRSRCLGCGGAGGRRDP